MMFAFHVTLPFSTHETVVHQSYKTTYDLFLFFYFFQLWVCTVVAACGTVLATFGICSSKPPTPPTASAAEGTEQFFLGLKKVRILSLWHNFVVLYWNLPMGKSSCFSVVRTAGNSHVTHIVSVQYCMQHTDTHSTQLHAHTDTQTHTHNHKHMAKTIFTYICGCDMLCVCVHECA